VLALDRGYDPSHNPIQSPHFFLEQEIYSLELELEVAETDHNFKQGNIYVTATITNPARQKLESEGMGHLQFSHEVARVTRSVIG